MQWFAREIFRSGGWISNSNPSISNDNVMHKDAAEENGKTWNGFTSMTCNLSS